MNTAGVQERAALPREPFFFGHGGQLFGCYEAPAGRAVRDVAVVLCPPFAQEHIRAHRALLQLAVRLARSGFPVLRFDWFGSGDSAGELGEASLSRWISDAHAAADEAKRRSGRSRVALVGMRLGATLALHAAEERDDVSALVLWGPVGRGDAYLDELGRLQAELLRTAYVRPAPGAYGHAAREVLGFALPPALREELSGLRLPAPGRAPAHAALLVVQHRAGDAALDQMLLESGRSVESVVVPEPGIWLAEPFTGLVPKLALDAIIRWLNERRA